MKNKIKLWYEREGFIQFLLLNFMFNKAVINKHKIDGLVIVIFIYLFWLFLALNVYFS